MFKNLSILLLGMALFIACNDNDEQQEQNVQNKIAVLKVDYLTNTFEGGTVLNFPNSDDFTISSDYQPPGDFGDIQLYYDELDELLFDGTIIWMGLGERSFPSQLMGANEFSLSDSLFPQPNDNLFEYVWYDEFAMYPAPGTFPLQWAAIDQLEIVHQYRVLNPNGTIHMFLYTPSVGIGNPADWDWYIFMKN